MTTAIIIRASSLPGFGDCPRRWAARHLYSDVTDAGFALRSVPTGAASVVGTAVHAGAAEALTEKMTRGTLAPLSQATDRAIESLRAAEDEDEILWTDRDIKDVNDAERHIIAMTGVYHESVAPGIRPASVETRLDAMVCDGVVLSGQADVVEEDGTVRDLKTTSMTTGSWGPQVGGYARLARSYGTMVESAAIDIIRRGTTRRAPDASTLIPDVRACEVANQRIIEAVLSARSVFLSGDSSRSLPAGDPWAFAANPQSKTCGPKYCPAWGTEFCKEHAPKGD